VDAEERARLDAVLAMIQPISARADGLLLDARNTAAPPEIDLDAILVPTFIASAEDDRYRTAESARMLAEGIAEATLMITPDGGHVWAGRAQEVEAATVAFLRKVLPEN
jgi:pimeloyl-ACP methyl ester carboxylesterase